MSDANWEEFEFNEGYEGELVRSVNGIVLPKQYLEFMKRHNGGEGDIGKNWFILYPLDELQEINDDLEIQEYLPNHVIIGGNGNDELYGITADGNYFNVPIMLEPEYLKLLGDDIDLLPLEINKIWS